jgi:hypothetical protein
LEAELQQLREEVQRQTKAAADAEAKRKAAETEQQRLAAMKEEEQRQAKAAEVEAKLRATEAEKQRLASLTATGLFTIRENTEAIGPSGDISRYTPTISVCQQNCEKLRDCKAFSYNKSTGICLRYTQVPSVAPNAKFDTGIRQ